MLFRFDLSSALLSVCLLFFFFFNDTATTEIYTLSLHDALPISAGSLCAFFRHTLTLSPGAVSVAMYQDNQQLCAYKTNNGHTGVGINAYLGENPMDFSGPFGT